MEEGRDPMSLRAVARRAGITAPSIYDHFEDLDGVLDAVMINTFDALCAWLRRSVEPHEGAVERLRAACHAYVEFGQAHPAQYAILFSRQTPVHTAREKTVENMSGAEAFAFLLDGIRACVSAGESGSADPSVDAVGLWVMLHGYIGLRRGARDFPWPQPFVLDRLIDRVALLE
jgi:AcrR family transcriptional regulator